MNRRQLLAGLGLGGLAGLTIIYGLCLTVGRLLVRQRSA